MFIVSDPFLVYLVEYNYDINDVLYKLINHVILQTINCNNILILFYIIFYFFHSYVNFYSSSWLTLLLRLINMSHPKQVHGESELARELSNAGGKLVVVDFYADW